MMMEVLAIIRLDGQKYVESIPSSMLKAFKKDLKSLPTPDFSLPYL